MFGAYLFYFVSFADQYGFALSIFCKQDLYKLHCSLIDSPTTNSHLQDAKMLSYVIANIELIVTKNLVFDFADLLEDRFAD